MPEDKQNIPEGERAETLGSYLRACREERGLSVDEVARELKVAPRYVSALEEDAYELFPAKIYAHGFLKRMLILLAGEEQDSCMQWFQDEWARRMAGKDRRPIQLPRQTKTFFTVTPRRLAWVFGSIALIAFLILLGMQLAHFTGAPRLVLEEPRDQFAADQPMVRVRGTTEKESQLTVNGREIIIDGVGYFHTEIQLQPGFNELEFIVKNRFGKETKVIRRGVAQ